jgi:hypothetical protein
MVMSAAAGVPSAPTIAADRASAAAPTRALLAERLRCEKLLPDTALLSFAAGYKVMQQPSAQSKCPECGPSCSLLQAGKPYEGAHVAYTCNEPFSKELVERTIEPIKKELTKPVVLKGMGRAGILGEKDNGTWYTAVAFDDDTDCYVTIEWMHGKKDDVIALTRVALAGLKPADVKDAR